MPIVIIEREGGKKDVIMKLGEITSVKLTLN